MGADRESWKNRLGFLLAAVGSAVGLGNIWRFNYLAYKNGGGAFLIPYIAALLTAGLPILILEFGLGHKMRGAPPTAFEKVKNQEGKSFQGLGWWGVSLAMFGINLYYTVVISWCVSYFFHSFSLAWMQGNSVAAFFMNTHLQASRGIFSFGMPIWGIVGGLVLVWLLNWVIVYKGVQSGIEKANKVFMPILLALVSILVVRGLTLPGASEGVTQYLKPDFSRILDPSVWIDAYGQVFFTLSIGFGIMVAYSSYLPKKSNISTSAKLTAILNSGFSLFAGLAVFGTLGYLAQAKGVPVDQVVKSGPGLAFIVFPEAIARIPLLPHLFGLVFFLALIVAGLSSSLSLVEAFASSVVDKFGWKRQKIVSILCMSGFIGGLIFTLPNGIYWLDTVDNFMTNYGLVTVGLLQCLVIGWVYGAKSMRRHINLASETRIHGWWDFCIKYVTPIILLILLGVKINGEIGKLFVSKSSPALSWTSGAAREQIPLSGIRSLSFMENRKKIVIRTADLVNITRSSQRAVQTWRHDASYFQNKGRITLRFRLRSKGKLTTHTPDSPYTMTLIKKDGKRIKLKTDHLFSLSIDKKVKTRLSSAKILFLLSGLLWLIVSGFLAWFLLKKKWRNPRSLTLGHHFEEGEDYHLH